MNDDTTDGLDSLSLTELLDRLHSVVEPEPISWVPQTTAWAVLAVVLAIVTALAAWRWQRRWQRNRYRREALAELDRIEAQAEHDLPVKVAELLRRTALVSFDRHDVASLFGNDWLVFLDRSQGGNTFTSGPGHVLTTAPYGAAVTEGDRRELIGAARGWIRTHHAGV